MTATLPTLDEIRADFADLQTGSERLEYLVELGRALPRIPDELRREEHRVQGCQSNVWLVAERVPGESDTSARLRFQAASDAPMVQGLVAILLAAYSDRTPKEILEFAPTALFEQLRLRTFLSPMRSNGLHSMVLHVRKLAERVLGESGRKDTAAQPRVAAVTRAGMSETAGATSERVEPLAPATVPPFSADELQTLRAEFPILAARLDDGVPLVYLDNAASTQRPRAVLDAMTQAYECYYGNVHRGGHWLAARTTELYEAARRGVQELLHARHAHEVVFTAGTTASVNLVARAWGDSQLRAGDQILLTEMEHHSNLIPWQQLAERRGCQLKFVPVTDDGQLDLAQLDHLLEGRVRLVAFTAVSNVLGTLNPIAEIARRSHAAGAVVLLDAAQAVPHLPLDVRDLDVDFLAFSGHKMLGPTGIGALYGKEALLDAMPPFLGGGSMLRSATLQEFVPAALPAKFEAGTPPIVEAIGLGAAINFLRGVGLDRIHAHERELGRRARAALAEIAGIRLLGPRTSLDGGIVSFSLAGGHPDDVAKLLDARGIAIRAGHHCAMPLHARLGLAASCRASFYCYNTPTEVDALAEGVAEAQRVLSRPKEPS